MRKIIACIALLLSSPAAHSADAVVGSKIFTESYILGEIAAQTLEAVPNAKIERRLGMGATGILFESLQSGAIDVYPDYTGTIAEAILKNPSLKSENEIKTALAPLGLTISAPLGFNNTYAIAVTAELAAKFDLHKIGDLAKVGPELKAAFTHEFMNRSDGFKGLTTKYDLKIPTAKIVRMVQSLAYRAIEDGSVNVIDVYSTDAKIEKLNLRVLTDDRSYFPSYQAVWVARTAFVDKHPDLWNALGRLCGTMDEVQMRQMNAKADLEKTSIESVASEFLGTGAREATTLTARLLQRTEEHLWLVGVALLFSILVGIPLGFVAARYPVAGQSILLTSGLVQTIPSLALLCFLIPLFGVGNAPALTALCLYSLLPVVMNTYVGIRGIDAKHLENARAYGLSRRQILFRIVFPLASPTILAGVKTATIVSIGTATLAALVGAGGYGVAIVSGLSLNDVPTILTGAVPAAAMALVAYVLFDLLGRLVVPAGLRKK
ncbi:glycine betaine ABC transporter substrate-binding protein [soil metagenome]